MKLEKINYYYKYNKFEINNINTTTSYNNKTTESIEK